MVVVHTKRVEIVRVTHFLSKRGSTWGILREWRCLNHSDSPPPLPNKHYWQVTDEDFERAIQGSSKAVQNPAQHLHVSARTDSQGTSTADEKTLVLPVHAPECESLHGRGVGDEGLEPPTSTV